MGGRGQEPAEWRAQVLHQTLLWAVRLGAFLALIVLFAIGSAEPARLTEPGFLLMFAAFAGILLLRYSAGTGSYRQRASAFSTLLWLLGSAAIYNVGLLPGPVLCSAFAVISAGLFLGRRPMWLVLAASTASVLLFGGRHANGYLPAPHMSPALLGVFFASGYGCVTGAIAILVRYVVLQIECSLRAASEALQRLSIAEQERSRSERALADAELALQRSQKLEAVGRLAAGVGHDFNNSLQVVLSWSTLLQGETDPAQLEEGLNAIQRAALHGSELTRRLLTFGRRDVRAPRSVDAHELLDDGARALRRMLPEDIAISVEQQDGGARVMVDTAQIAHVLLNLGLNARDAMPEGGRLTLGSRQLRRADLPADLSSAPGLDNWVELTVADTGVGMSPETLAHLFEPFFTTKGERGNGLGLATSYALVQRNGGFIRAESELGQGAIFRIYFPEQASDAADVGVISPTPLPRAGLGVMVAEDDENVRSSIVRALGAAGFRVFESADAPSAIRLLQRVGREIDVLCTDGIMPGGGTRELIDRYLSQRPEGKVILCSGYVKEELLRRQIDAGALAYLAKPFLPAELVERIHELIQPNPRSAEVQLKS